VIKGFPCGWPSIRLKPEGGQIELERVDGSERNGDKVMKEKGGWKVERKGKTGNRKANWRNSDPIEASMKQELGRVRRVEKRIEAGKENQGMRGHRKKRTEGKKKSIGPETPVEGTTRQK